jgi:hypothetical protein
MSKFPGGGIFSRTMFPFRYRVELPSLLGAIAVAAVYDLTFTHKSVAVVSEKLRHRFGIEHSGSGILPLFQRKPEGWIPSPICFQSFSQTCG